MSRRSGPILLSIVVHIGVAAALVPALLDPRYLDRIFSAQVAPESERERVIYLRTPPAPPAAPDTAPAPRSTVRRTVEQIPTALAAAPAVIESVPASGAGVAASVDPDPGRVTLVPGSADPRIWNARAPYASPPPSHAAILEGSLGRAIGRANDSISALGVQNVRPDWLIGREGRRFGIADDRIHLGPVQLPAVALGLAPIPGFGCMPKMFFPDRPVRDSAGIICMQLENPVLAERAERISEMSAEIRARAPLATAAREEIARIAMRKDRERAARLRAQAGRVPDAPPGP